MMAEPIHIQEEPRQPLSMHPQKFAMWLFLVTVVMVFASFTSAYIVQQSEGAWTPVELPPIFWINSGIILLSSFSMQWAYYAAKKDNLSTLKIAMVITTILGVAFLVGQWLAWGKLVEMNIFFAGDKPLNSFLYVFTGVHSLHLVSGVIYLVVVLIFSFQYKVHSKRMINMEMLTTYWHFLDGLWLYLFLFLWLNN